MKNQNHHSKLKQWVQMRCVCICARVFLFLLRVCMFHYDMNLSWMCVVRMQTIFMCVCAFGTMKSCEILSPQHIYADKIPLNRTRKEQTSIGKKRTKNTAITTNSQKSNLNKIEDVLGSVSIRELHAHDGANRHFVTCSGFSICTYLQV